MLPVEIYRFYGFAGLILLAVSLYYLIKSRRELSMTIFRVIIMSLAILLVTFAFFSFFPLEEFAYFGGEATLVDDILNTPKNLDIYFLKIGSSYINNRADKLLLKTVLRWYQPIEFVQRENTPLSFITNIENKTISRALAIESFNNAYLASLNFTNTQINVERSLVAEVIFQSTDFSAIELVKEGDTILLIDGFQFVTRNELDKYINQNNPESITITLLRNNKIIDGVELFLSEKHPGIFSLGFWPVEKRTFEVPPNLPIISSEHSGDSAGLMLSINLSLYLIDHKLSEGYIIAGTGAISEDGQVKPVGGTRNKLATANKIKADIFFVPAVHLEEAYRAQTELKLHNIQIVPVTTLKEAIDFLLNL